MSESENTVEVEWDPECYDETMAAITAWVPSGLNVTLRGRFLYINYSRFGSEYSGLIKCTHRSESGLSIFCSQRVCTTMTPNEKVYVDASSQCLRLLMSMLSG
jgi:hypothetical protein